MRSAAEMLLIWLSIGALLIPCWKLKLSGFVFAGSCELFTVVVLVALEALESIAVLSVLALARELLLALESIFSSLGEAWFGCSMLGTFSFCLRMMK